MIVYEYPLNEKVRTWLRFERVINRINNALANRENDQWEWVAIKNLIDLIDISDRSELKSEVLKELIRLQNFYDNLSEREDVDQHALKSMKERIINNLEKLRNMPSRPGQFLYNNPWLSVVSSRMSMAGGCNEFDVPSYKWWDSQETGSKIEDFEGFYNVYSDLNEAINIILLNIRESSTDQEVLTENGAVSILARPHNVLIQIKLADNSETFPEVTAHRLSVNVRLLKIIKSSWEIKQTDYSSKLFIRQCFSVIDESKQEL